MFCFPKSSVCKESTCDAADSASQVRFLSREDPLEKERQPTPVFLPGESHGQQSLVDYISWGRKELDRTEPLSLYQTFKE